MKYGTVLTALAAATLGLVPASAQAATKFGADLAGGPQPQNAAQDCGQTSPALEATEPCTRIAYNFNEAGPINGNSKAPRDGTIDKLKLIAQQSGRFTFQLGRLRNLDANSGTGQGRITRSGGKIDYDASDSKRGAGYQIQTFNVDVTVKKNEYIAVKAREFSAQTCSSGSERQLVFQPPPAVGGSFQANDADENCSMLVQAVYE